MNRDRGTMPKSKKHLSAPNSFTKPNRKKFQVSSRSSSLSSNRTSSEQSNEDNGLCISQSVKNVSSEDKDSLMKKLQSQVKELRQKLRVLEECIENKEYSLGVISREKDRALGEIRRLERNNKQLRQQLNDERNHYLEEKEKFCEEMTRYKKRLQEIKTNDTGKKTQSMVPLLDKISVGTWQKGDSAEIQMKTKHLKSITAASITGFRKTSSLDSMGLYEGQDLSLQMAALRTENAKLRAIINEREERNYELCLRFLRMKHSKNDLRNRFQDLENEYLQLITNLMEKIDEAREEFNYIIDQKFKKPLHTNNAKYLRMVQRNSKITFENVNLRMELQNLKKELNKLNFGQGDYRRKMTDGERNNLAVDEKSRKSTRQTRNGTPGLKASDTDSNYMSKTSTTDPSTGSLPDAKSNESISADGFESGAKSKTPNLQNLFSEDILHKLFERVDSHSILNSKRDLENENYTAETVCNIDAKNRAKRKSDDQVKFGQNLQPKEIPPLLEEGLRKRFVPCSLNSKKFHEVTTQSATKKIASGRKDKKRIQPMDDVSDKDKFSEISKSRRRFSETGARPKSRSQYAEVKDRIRSYPDSDKTPESDKETRAKRASSWSKLKDKKGQDRVEGDEIRTFGNPRRYRSRKERRQRVFVRDSCGLEEKLDTDGEISPDFNYQISGRKPRSEKVIDQLAIVKHNTQDEVRETTRERVWNEAHAKLDGDTNSEDSAFGSNSAQMRNRNSVSLHDELMEVTKTQSQKDDPFWRRELNLHSLITEKSASSSKTYRLNGRSSRFLSEGHTPENIEEDDALFPDDKVLMVETKVLRKNHRERERSRSQSPHQSKPRSEHGLPLEMTPESRWSNPTDKNNEFVLQFLMPPAAILSTQSFLFGKDDTCKEPSIHLAKEQGPLPQAVQHQLSPLMLPGSNMASSCTIMEMGDSSAARETGLASRTVSAPALIESDWLNTFKMCEMKDCSTNT